MNPGNRRPKEGRILGDFEIECYSGYKENETPRSVVIGGQRIEVAEILERKRVREAGTGATSEVFVCRLEDGERMCLERSEDGSWKIRSRRQGRAARLTFL